MSEMNHVPEVMDMNAMVDAYNEGRIFMGPEALVEDFVKTSPLRRKVHTSHTFHISGYSRVYTVVSCTHTGECDVNDRALYEVQFHALGPVVKNVLR